MVSDTIEETIFGPALDAASGELWPRHASRGQRDGTVAAAQSRYITQAARWLGLCEDEFVADAIFEALELPCLSAHRQARKNWTVASSRKMRGQVVECIVEALPLDGMCCERLLRAGMATQVFDAVYMVDHTGVIRRLPPLGSG